jgi:hypothetical protein
LRGRTVGVAQLVELLVVVQAVVGSSPIAHPPKKPAGVRGLVQSAVQPNGEPQLEATRAPTQMIRLVPFHCSSRPTGPCGQRAEIGSPMAPSNMPAAGDRTSANVVAS